MNKMFSFKEKIFNLLIIMLVAIKKPEIGMLLLIMFLLIQYG